MKHTIIRGTGRILKVKLYLLIFLLVPLAAFTLLTSKTTLIPGVQSFIVISGSMEPTLPVGSIVYTQKEARYERGEVVAFKNSSGQTVTHRIIDELDNQFTTKGDANTTVDLQTVSSSAIVGKTFFNIPYLGSFVMYLKTPFGFFTILIVPIIIFMLLELLTMKKEFEKELEKRVAARVHRVYHE